jgi:enoyl-CoA hydratase
MAAAPATPESGSDAPVLVQKNGGVGTLLINRPSRLNALDDEVLEHLFEGVVDLEEDDDIGAIVVSGNPETKRPAFAAGADISQMAEMGGIELRGYSLLGQETFSAIENCSKPVIAAINGFAFGGGCELAMACHIRYASKDAKLGQPEINLGIIPGFGGTQRLARLVGRGRALEILLTGDPMDADEALRIGLVNRVFEPQQLMVAANDLAQRLAAKAPIARQLILDAVCRGLECQLDTSLAMESDLFGIVGSTADVKEGLKAFLEKRTPTWRGR